MARFQRGMALRPIKGIKHIVEASNISAATVNSVGMVILNGVDQYTLADVDGCPAGSKVNGIFLSIFIISEGGELATEVPLADWYIIVDKGNQMGSTFSATRLPTPGATGSHIMKSKIIHTEKGLAGGGDLSLNGVPMIFKGVIVIPKGMRRVASNDQIKLCIRTNFDSKFCVQAIYKHYE